MKEITIILTRHGRYNNTRNKEDINAGHITEDGKKEIEVKTTKRIEKYVGNDLKNTMFLVIGSPTHWLSDKKLGQRGIETEEITIDTIRNILINNGIDSKGCLYKDTKLYTRNHKGELSIKELAEKLSEPNVYDKAPEYIRKLKSRHNGMTNNFWGELSTSEEVKNYNTEAEDPTDLTKKIKGMLEYIIKWAKEYEQAKDKNVFVILITHGETMAPFLNSQKIKYLTTGGYNDGIVFRVTKNGIIVETEKEDFIGPPKLINLEER